MVNDFKLVKPNFLPPLDLDFRPAVLANQAFQNKLKKVGVPLVIALKRDSGKITRFETRVYPDNHPDQNANLYYAERLVKFLLWQRGGYEILIGGPHRVGEYIQHCYASNGSRSFDHNFMSELVYERPFKVEQCDLVDIPLEQEAGESFGQHFDGCRIGFDLGASDRKVSAVVDGRVVYSEEVIWEPKKHPDPTYHYDEIITAIKTAASKMERVDAIGGSSAGIFIKNRPMVASLFRGISPDRLSEVRDLFNRIGRDLNVPIVVINDGDVAALAGSMFIKDNGILGIAFGSSQAAGYIDPQGLILGWLNELTFAPVDYSPNAPIDEWSGDIGCGSQYFSQQCVFRLAPRVGIQVPSEATDAEKLLYVQEKLEAGHEGAKKIWQSMGIYLGYGLAHYANFYDIKHVLLLGRCTSGSGGSLIVDGANSVLCSEFPEVADRLHIGLPDEGSRRVSQSVAAASLPDLFGQ